jgi:hypothetical protein
VTTTHTMEVHEAAATSAHHREHRQRQQSRSRTLEYTEPQGLEGLVTTMAFVRESSSDSRCAKSASHPRSGCKHTPQFGRTVSVNAMCAGAQTWWYIPDSRGTLVLGCRPTTTERTMRLYSRYSAPMLSVTV